MANISHRAKSVIEEYLKMGQGYLLDFSDRTFNAFFMDFGIDMTEDKYYRLSSGSKANRFRVLMEDASNEELANVLSYLLGQRKLLDENTQGYEAQPVLEMSFTDVIKELVSVNKQIPPWENPVEKKVPNTLTNLVAQSLVKRRTPRSSADTPLVLSPLITQQSFQPRQEKVKSVQSEEPKSLKKVFIVHGHDELVTLSVKSFIQDLGLVPIILRSQASAGQTILEKLISYGKVDYAIILYTHCDEGRKAGDTDFKPRARQNVVFEHGYFIGTLGRDKVAAIVKQGVEIQNDISGVVYIGWSDGSDWKTQLVIELEAAKLKVDRGAVFK
ncbi:hypothetical protein FM037_02290 [Shewanella psychropiezotolerans]|uniref:CD-NTase-associated protein 12/Pycsar effector protein TIR domain-containing protein n=1 Tax=Shewanella psychropiezotolerans TaxID=2593655 RepID=A0ABX5WVU6_9GAMM|nr:nucleotide-binding protein [Shewanella psychropiezotolerans]QDO82282.1 hypothetical protein FM037_02290 [Shewanella psychropiezotolerans]